MPPPIIEIKSVDEAHLHLTHIQGTIKDDIWPALNLPKIKGGYYSVPRLILCYIDYLGFLYCGKSGSKSAVQFIREVMGKIDLKYSKYGGILYLVFRHGTIHEFMPKWFIFENRRIGHVISKSKRNFKWKGENYSHLKIKNNRIPIALQKLYMDLLSSIERFQIIVQQDDKIFKNFQTAYRTIMNQQLKKENGIYFIIDGDKQRANYLIDSDLQDFSP